jgi:5-formyltetrahydrofolate cyclo-ligase
MNKAQLRQLYLEKRKQYSPEELQSKSLQITMHFFSRIALEEVKCLHVFLPITRQNETDTWPIIQRITKNYPAIQIAIPKADLASFSMESYLYQPGISLHTNKWGMTEPQNSILIEPAAIDMILLPLLAFDERGYRVGYGKGFYDRYLPRCRKNTIKVGLSLEQPVPAITDTDHYDARMDYCITPHKVWEFV